MRRSAALAVGMSAAVLGVSCSLIDLSSRINQAPCSAPSDCVLINDSAVEPSFRPCQPFVCSERHFCEAQQLDNDQDGFFPAKCAAKPSEADCNDFDPSVHPTADEVCDDSDNDCDGQIDEGSLPIDQTVAVTFDGRTPVSDMSAAIYEDHVALGYVIDAAAPQLAANVIAYQDISLQEVTPLRWSTTTGDAVRAASASVALLRGPMRVPLLIVGGYVTTDPARLIVANVQGGSQLTSSRITANGLTCDVSEACAANSGGAEDPNPVLPSPSSSTPTMVPGSEGMLVAYVRSTSGELCGSDRMPETRPILANLVSSAASSTSERTKRAFSLGDTAENASPALAGISVSTTNGRPYGWLLAYPNLAGEIVLAQVIADGENLHVSEPLSNLRSSAGPLYSPRFAEGIRTPDHVAFGLVARQGCGEASTVVMAVLDVTLGSLGGVAVRVETKLSAVGSGRGDRAPAIAFNVKRRNWGIAYRDAVGVRARIVDATGIATGAEPYVIVEGGADQPVQSVAIASLSSINGWFSVLAYDDADGGSVRKSDLTACMRP